MTAHESQIWTEVCRIDELTPERGVAALIGYQQLAVFRTFDNALYAIDNIDPYTRAAVLSRGIVGDRQGEPTVASPLHKQVFSLVTGRCLDDLDVAVASYPVRCRDGIVEVSIEAA